MEQLILTKAQELFFRHGIKAISMDDIAREAGMSKKTIYQAFVSKTEVLEKVIKNMLGGHKECIKQCASKAENVVDEVLQSARAPFEKIATISQHFFFELKRFFPELWQVLVRYQNSVMLPAITRNIKQGIAEGYYRSDLQVDFVAEVRANQITTALNLSDLSYTTFTGSRLMLHLSELFLYGIVTEKGKKLIPKYLKTVHETSL